MGESNYGPGPGAWRQILGPWHGTTNPLDTLVPRPVLTSADENTIAPQDFMYHPTTLNGMPESKQRHLVFLYGCHWCPRGIS